MADPNEERPSSAQGSPKPFFRTPKNALWGLAYGAQSVLLGVCLGVAGLIMEPIKGLKKEKKIKGFALGVGLGVASIVLLPIAGVCKGAVEAGKGANSSIQNVKKKIRNRRDEVKKLEATQSSEEEQQEYEAARQLVASELIHERSEPMPSTSPSEASEASRSPSDSSSERESHTPPRRMGEDPVSYKLYSILDVSKGASEAAIRRAYLLKARSAHPDSGGSDDEFQALSNAYQVLSDPVRRRQYDQFGDSVVGDSNFVDASEFFTMAFGSKEFEPFIGKLTVVELAENMNMSPDEMMAKQAAREQVLCDALMARLHIYVDGASDTFEDSMIQISMSLVQTPFGANLLEAIGIVYSSEADRFKGYRNLKALGIPGLIAAFKSKKRTVGRKFELLSKVQEADNRGEAVDSTMEMMEIVWLISCIDIESTLSAVCRKVLKSAPGESSSMKYKRAEALGKLGAIMQTVAAEAEEQRRQ